MQQERLQFSMFSPVQKFVLILNRLAGITALNLSLWIKFFKKTQHYNELLTLYNNLMPLRHFNRVEGLAVVRLDSVSGSRAKQSRIFATG